MKIWGKRLAAAALVIAGVYLFVSHLKKLLARPYLYPDLGQFSTRNLVFLGLALLFFAFAWIGAAYLLLNTKQKILHLLIPAAAFAVLLTLSGLCLTEGVGEIPCTYTASTAAFREQFDAASMRVQGKSLYPAFPTGELSAYSYYEKDGVLAESVTRSYDQDGYNGETSRLAALSLPSFQPEQDPREREITCYEVRQGDTVWQVLTVPKTKTVTYSRFCRPEELPSFPAQPTEKP